jgi:hypothetical protein
LKFKELNINERVPQSAEDSINAKYSGDERFAFSPANRLIPQKVY